MKKLLGMLFSERYELRVKIFNLLAVTGTVVSLIIFFTSLFNSAGLLNLSVLLFSAVLSVSLLIYSLRTQKYKVCYILTIIFVFMILFPIMFFTAGGYHSGMPSFFVFSIVFTVYMLDGKAKLIFGLLELLEYAGCCIVGYTHPETVTAFPDEKSILTDIITGFVIAGISLSATIILQLRMYDKQQKQLEKAIDEARRSDQAKGIFLANMSHEIRTPINVILGMNEMIHRISDSGEIQEYSAKIQSSGDILLSIINNILDVTQIESGHISIVNRPYRTDTMLSGLIASGRELSTRHGLKFNSETDESLPCILSGDKNRICQIVTCFLSNAAKYASDGSITLKAGFEPSDSGFVKLKISVSDTGIGIPQEDIATIFSTFSRGSNVIDTAVNGTGLGLSVAKQLSDAMGGELFVESREGEGSTFGIALVQNVISESPVGEMQGEAADMTANDSFLAPDCHILVVDDNADNLRVIRLLLEHTMLRIDTADDGLSGAELAAKNDYDVILLDYMMPELDGIATLELMRKNGLPARVPVVVLTAEVLAGSEEKFMAAGFTTYISKPVKAHTLEKALMSLLPEDKVRRSSFAGSDTIPQDEFEMLRADLADHDIDIDAGLGMINGNISLFYELASIFTESCKASQERLETLFRERNFSDMLYEVHSLKSRAHGVGAIALKNIAAETEKRLKSGDEGYVTACFELLMLEYRRAEKGLGLFLKTAEKYISREADSGADGISELVSRISDGIRHHLYLETQSDLKHLTELVVDDEARAELNNVSELVEELDFACAEPIFDKLTERILHE